MAEVGYACALLSSPLTLLRSLATRWVQEFAKVDAVADLAPHMPYASPQLTAGTYETALISLLDGNGTPDGRTRQRTVLVECVRAWPPRLYNTSAVATAVARAAAVTPGGMRAAPLLMEVLALLHCQSSHHQVIFSPPLVTIRRNSSSESPGGP